MAKSTDIAAEFGRRDRRAPRGVVVLIVLYVTFKAWVAGGGIMRM